MLHPRLFPNGFQYFNKRTVQREGRTPLVVQNNWIMGAHNKRHRFREAQLWTQDTDAYYRGSEHAPLRLLTYAPEQPTVSGLSRETSALQAAIRLARLLNRTLLLPTFCAFTPDSGLVPPPPLVYRDRYGHVDGGVLDDTVDAHWCTIEWFYDMAAMEAELGHEAYREASFGANPRVLPSALDTAGLPPLHLAAPHDVELVPPPAGATVLQPADLNAGPTDDEIRAWLRPYASAPLIKFTDLAGRLGPRNSPKSPKATDSAARAVRYREEILRHVHQQIEAAAPFDCLCLQTAGIDLLSNVSALVDHFAARVPAHTTVFVAGYRVDLVGLGVFRNVWDRVHALALYDWNGDGLQARALPVGGSLSGTLLWLSTLTRSPSLVGPPVLVDDQSARLQ